MALELPCIEESPPGGFRVPSSSVFTLGVPFRIYSGYPPAVHALWEFSTGWLWNPPCSGGFLQDGLVVALLWGFPQCGFGIPLALGVPFRIFLCAPPRSWQRFGGSLRGAVVPPRFGDTPGMGLSFPPRITPCSGIPPAVFWVPHAVLPLWGLPLCCHRAGLSPPHRHPRRDPRTRSRTRYIHPQRSRGCPSAVCPFPAPSHLAEVRGSGFPSQQIPVLPSSL